jgi:hypothetical protein
MQRGGAKHERKQHTQHGGQHSAPTQAISHTQGLAQPTYSQKVPRMQQHGTLWRRGEAHSL